MRKGLICLLCAVSALLYSCDDNFTPKPKAYLALEFPPHQYERFNADCPYSFAVNTAAVVTSSFRHESCRFDIVYPKMDGTIYLTYEPVNGNLHQLLHDAQQLPLQHTIKADEIIGSKYSNAQHHTYGMLYTVTGNAASQTQFYLTDSVNHFITGSVYFRKEPNYDSIYPAAVYLKKDVEKLMESLQWQ